MRRVLSHNPGFIASGEEPIGPDIIVEAQKGYYLGAPNYYSSYNGSSDPRFQSYMTWVSTYSYTYYLDTQFDKAALDIAKQIKIAPHSVDTEYSAFIYKDSSGVIHSSNILKGDHESVGSHTLQEYGIPNGSILEGFIHNHPDRNAVGQTLTQSAFADNFDLNAIVNAEGYAQPSHNISVDRNNFRGYIEHGNVMDEYDYMSLYQNQYPINNGVVVYPAAHIDSTVVIGG